MGVILMVRHGQASFGAADYDQLSDLGSRQAERLGLQFRATAIEPVTVVAGSMQRQGATALTVAEGAGWEHDVVSNTAWDEFDHLALVSSLGEPPSDPKTFQRALEVGMKGWAQGEIGHVETFGDFRARVVSALNRLAGSLGSGQTAVVISSAGVISWIAASLVEGDVSQWLQFNRVCVNTGVTKIVAGRAGLSLISFNEHTHLPSAEVTYR